MTRQETVFSAATAPGAQPCAACNGSGVAESKTQRHVEGRGRSFDEGRGRGFDGRNRGGERGGGERRGEGRVYATWEWGRGSSGRGTSTRHQKRQPLPKVGQPHRIRRADGLEQTTARAHQWREMAEVQRARPLGQPLDQRLRAISTSIPRSSRSALPRRRHSVLYAQRAQRQRQLTATAT